MKKEYAPIITLSLSIFMTAVIWVVQLVHYPSFAFVHPDQFVAFHGHHVTSIGMIVVPIMLLELGFSGWLSYVVWNKLGWIQLLLVISIWLVTALLQVPTHNILEQGYKQDVVQQLITENWYRTALWTIKTLVLFGIFFDYNRMTQE